MTILQDLRAERERQNLSRPVLAKRLGYDPSSIKRWETGKRTPSVTQLSDWAEGLGLSIALVAA